MNILITGHRGFIGQNMWKALESEHNLVGYEWGDAIYSLRGIDHVIHLGAISSTTYTDTRQLLLQNYHFSAALVENCNKAGIPIHIASSASVYGIDNRTMVETDFPAPRNHYAWSKYLMEEYCMSRVWNVPVQLFRYFNVYGPMEDHKGDQASPIHKFNLQAKTGKITLFENSENYVRDFVPVEYVIDIHKKFFRIGESGIWNVGTGETKSFWTIAQQAIGDSDCTIHTIPMPENLKSSYQAYTKADQTKLRQTLKKYSLDL